MLTLLSKHPVNLDQLGKMVKYCRQTLGERGKQWDYDGGFRVRFNFKEEKDRTWFYFIFAPYLEDPHER